MADISKCRGEGCKVKDSCYRYTAPADPKFQAYVFPKDIADNGCSIYWPTKDVKQ